MDATILITVVVMIYLWNHLHRPNAQMHKRVFQLHVPQVVPLDMSL
jgi:fumarate reductase subunit D